MLSAGDEVSGQRLEQPQQSVPLSAVTEEVGNEITSIETSQEGEATEGTCTTNPESGNASAEGATAEEIPVTVGTVAPVTDPIDLQELEYREQKLAHEKLMLDLIYDRSIASPSYLSNSKKEALVLHYVENFRRQFTLLYPSRKELLLYPLNTFGIPKFVCTFIRPTQLPYNELYDHTTCARFVADYLTYVPLEPAHDLPKSLLSPSDLLKVQKGNCFEYSLLLTSLLRGVGYDAYVVSGYATKDITTMDQSKTATTELDLNMFDASIPGLSAKAGKTETDTAGQHAKEGGLKDAASSEKYKVKPVRKMESLYIQKQKQRAEAAALLRQETSHQNAEATIASSQQSWADDEDELQGLRVHAWVLVMSGKREIAESFFIETSTGKFYPLDSSHHLGVECVFNSNNYWANMQACVDGLKNISFDLSDNNKWEFILMGNSFSGGGDTEGIDEKENVDDDDVELETSLTTNVLDLPPSWVNKIEIPQDQFGSKCPGGRRSITYKDARCDIFAHYKRKDGMILRITYFGQNDSTVNNPHLIQEYFANRKDKLIQRTRKPNEQVVQEFFARGRSSSIQEHLMKNGVTKELHFYPEARVDGLHKRVDMDGKVIEYFTGRDDNLYYRSATFDMGAEDSKNYLKLTEKFAIQASDPESIKKVTYFLKEEKIKVVYHPTLGKLVSSFREYRKPGADQKTSDQFTVFDVDPYAAQPKKQTLWLKLLDLLKSENACLSNVRASERELSDILLARKQEEAETLLHISVYDTVRNANRPSFETENESGVVEEELPTPSTLLDYLSPFIVNYATNTIFTKDEASSIKDACLKSLKDRLIEKTAIIQSRLDEVTSEYQRRQLQYSRAAETLSSEETDEYVKFCNNALFKIHILEKRLSKQKEVVPEKYLALDQKLRNDPRLQTAFSA